MASIQQITQQIPKAPCRATNVFSAVAVLMLQGTVDPPIETVMTPTVAVYMLVSVFVVPVR